MERCVNARLHASTVVLAKKFDASSLKAGQLSLRQVSNELAARGYLNERGKPYAAKSVASMLKRCPGLHRPSTPGEESR